MSDQQQWQEQNTKYMSAALAWLRLRLERLAQQRLPQPLPASVALLPAPQAGYAPVAPAPHIATNGNLSAYARQMAEAETNDAMQPALIMLGQRLQMTRFEREVLLLCVAMELDTRIATLCAHAQDDASKPYPTFALALVLFDEPVWEMLAPERPLRHWRLIEINQSAAQPLTTSPLRADERIVNFVKGLNNLDDRLTSLVSPVVITEQEDLPPSQQYVIDQVIHTWKQSATSPQPPVIQLPGADVSSKLTIAYHVAATIDCQCYRLPAELMPTQAADIDLFARLWQRESRLSSLMLYLDLQESDPTTANDGPALLASRFLARGDGFFFLGVREMWPRIGRASVAFDVTKPTVEEQMIAWTKALGVQVDDQPGILAAQFNLNIADINHIAAVELSEPDDTSTPLSQRLWNACLLS